MLGWASWSAFPLPAEDDEDDRYRRRPDGDWASPSVKISLWMNIASWFTVLLLVQGWFSLCLFQLLDVMSVIEAVDKQDSWSLDNPAVFVALARCRSSCGPRHPLSPHIITRSPQGHRLTSSPRSPKQPIRCWIPALWGTNSERRRLSARHLRNVNFHLSPRFPG